MMKKTLDDAFPIVAAALGNHLGVRVTVKGQCAQTDGETITLPAYDGSHSDYRDIAWGYLAHEAAHLRYTNFAVFRSACTHPLRKSILNILEDVRIEKRLAERYPGTRHTIEKTIGVLVDSGTGMVPPVTAHPGALVEAALLYGLRCRVLGQTRLKDVARQAEERLKTRLPPMVFDFLMTLEEEIKTLDDTAATLALTDHILRVLEGALEDQVSRGVIKNPPKTSHRTPEQLCPSGSSTESSQGSDSEDSAAFQADEMSEKVTQTKTLGSLMDIQEADLGGDLFDKARQILALQEENQTGIILPVRDQPPLDRVRGQELLDRALKDSSKLRACLQGLVQAERLGQPRARRIGTKIDGTRLSRLVTGDARVFRRPALRKTPNTAVHVLIDRSPSMGALVTRAGAPLIRRIDLAWEATLALAVALEGIPGVNVGISAFPGKDGEGDSIYAVLPHGSTVKGAVGAFGGDLDGSTPLAGALWYAGAQLLQQPEARKILLVLTDGIPDDLEKAAEILERCQRSTIEVTGIGLGIEVDQVFKSNVCVTLIEDLPIRLNEVSKRLLLSR